MAKLCPYVDTKFPVVLAHQGNRRYAPANTLVAFEQAIALGADIIETDAHWTKDGQIVLCHDATVDRTSDGTGAIADMTLTELRRLDFGYRFTQDAGLTFPYRGCNIRIPTLTEVLTTFPNHRLNIDIKPKRPGSLKQFIREVFDARAEYRVLVASFQHRTLQQFRALNPIIATSASVRETAEFRFGIRTHRDLPYCALQVPLNAYGISVVSGRFVKRAHQAGVKVHVWTIDDEPTMKSLFAGGVDGIVSNDPGTAVRVRNQWIKNGSA